MLRWPLLSAAILLACFAAAVAGCGGGDSGPSESTTVETGPLTKAQFIKKAGEACVGERKRMGVRLLKLGTQGEQESLEKGWETVFLPGLEAHIEDVRELGAPRGQKAEVEALLGAMQKAIDEADEERPKTFKRLVAHFTTYNKLAGAYGLTGCEFH